MTLHDSDYDQSILLISLKLLYPIKREEIKPTPSLKKGDKITLFDKEITIKSEGISQAKYVYYDSSEGCLVEIHAIDSKDASLIVNNIRNI